MGVLEELRRRGVLRVGSAYAVTAWLFAQVVEFLTDTFAAPAWVLQAVVMVLGVTLVPVLVFTWMFEFTPQGFRRQSELDRAGLVVSRAGRRLDYVIALMVLVAAGWFAFEWSQRIRVAAESGAAGAAPQAATVAQAPANSIAVLPFLNLSTADDGGILADGLAEELLGVLGRNRELRVTARSSAFQFKDQNRDLREVGRLLGVRYVLEGSVRLAGQRVKIGTQLVDAANGVQLWSETYDRTLADLFALQEDIAGEVAKALKIVITAVNDTPARAGTRSVEAHMELLRALQAGSTRIVADLDVAIAHLQRAIALDPGYAQAYVELAYAMHARALQLEKDIEVLPEVAPLLDKALQLDPQSGEALVLRGALFQGDPAIAERTIREGLALAPSHARGYEALAQVVSQDPARVDEALGLLDRAIALDPLAPRNYQVKGILLWTGKGDLDGAERAFLRAVEVEPRYRMALMQLALTYMSRGDFARAVLFGERTVAVDPSPMIRRNLAHQYLNIGDPDAARALNKPEDARIAAEIQLALGDIAGAVAILRAIPGQRESGVSVTAVAALRDAAANGHWSENLPLVAAAIGYDGSVPAELNGFGFNEAVMAAMLRGAGKVEEADRLCDALLGQLDVQAKRAAAWEQGPFNWGRAMVLAQQGRREEALDALEKAFNPARPYWWMLLDGNPMFEGLRQEPRYRALRERLATHLAAQRELLAELHKEQAGPGAAAGAAVQGQH